MQLPLCQVFEIARFAFSDSVIFPALQASLLLVFVYAVAKNFALFRPKDGSSLTVRRGKESWYNFRLMYAMLVLIFVEVNNTSEALKGHKTLITLLDIAALSYLCYFNNWFRNKTLAAINASQEMEEK